MIDDSKKDRCELPVGELFCGGYALVKTGPQDFLGKVVLLLRLDEWCYWETLDRTGDLTIFAATELMPISEKDWDNKTDLDSFIYEARYGV